MKEYLFLFRGQEAHEEIQSPESTQAHMQKWVLWMRSLSEQGKLGASQPLDSSGKKLSGLKKVVTDGPFMEGKEMVGGYLICKADNYDEAVEHAKGCPILDFEDGVVEVREIKEMAM
jgi:hypothetical protein